MLNGSEKWSKTYPGAAAGLLAISQVNNPEDMPP